MVRIALGQLNTTVGDLDGNVARMVEWRRERPRPAADLICFPELAITGYPPEDLVLRPAFVQDNLAALETLAASTAGSTLRGDGGVRRSVGRRAPQRRRADSDDGRRRRAVYHKIQLPELRRVRRAAVLRARDRAACTVRLASSDSACPSARTRGTATPRSTSYARTGRPVDPEHQRLAVSPRQGRRATGGRLRETGAPRRARGSST